METPKAYIETTANTALQFFAYVSIGALVLGILAIVFSILSRKNPAKSGLGTAGLVLGIIASVLAIISIIVAQTDWYQTTVTQQLIDTFGDQYADMLN